MPEEIFESTLILAAEDCDPGTFGKLHRFSKNDQRIISKLTAHGPVLLQGGRGSGKSALLLRRLISFFRKTRTEMPSASM